MVLGKAVENVARDFGWASYDSEEGTEVHEHGPQPPKSSSVRNFPPHIRPLRWPQKRHESNTTFAMSMITATAWVPRGFAAPFPSKYVFDDDEYERISKLAKLQLDDAKEELEEAKEDQKKSNGGARLLDTESVYPTHLSFFTN